MGRLMVLGEEGASGASLFCEMGAFAVGWAVGGRQPGPEGLCLSGSINGLVSGNRGLLRLQLTLLKGLTYEHTSNFF